MTDPNQEPDASAEPEIPKGLRFIEELRAKAEQLPPEKVASPEAAARFIGTIGLDEEGRPFPGLSEAQRQHKRDILAGRKQPGDPVDQPPPS